MDYENKQIDDVFEKTNQQKENNFEEKNECSNKKAMEEKIENKTTKDEKDSYFYIDDNGNEVQFTPEYNKETGEMLYPGYSSKAPYGYNPNGEPAKKPTTKEDEKKANSICILSLLFLVVPIFLRILSLLAMVICISIIDNEFLDNTTSIFDSISSVLASFSGKSFVASMVLMIVVRTKYPSNTFGKVLMFIFIGIGLLLVCGIVAFVVACNSCFAAL